MATTIATRRAALLRLPSLWTVWLQKQQSLWQRLMAIQSFHKKKGLRNRWNVTTWLSFVMALAGYNLVRPFTAFSQVQLKSRLTFHVKPLFLEPLYFFEGSHCIKSFIAMQTCVTANLEAFVKHGDESNRNNSSTTTEGESKPQLVPSPLAGAVKNPTL